MNSKFINPINIYISNTTEQPRKKTLSSLQGQGTRILKASENPIGM